ncbi:MAG: hypothetical protein ACJ8J0_04865 [Longimicrobiaceae bacterium]
MSSIPRPAVFLAMLALSALPRPSSLAAQTSYPLICRGGAGLRLASEVGSTGASVVRLRFNRARQGAVAGVEPGTCAWQDRGVRESEPAVLCFAPAQHLSFELANAKEIAWMRVQAAGGNAPVIFWEGGERPGGFAYQPGNAAEYEYYRAYHDPTRSCLAVTHVGP